MEVSLLPSVRWTLYASQPDGAGGSGETKRVGNNGVGVRAYAWHGYNGEGSASAIGTATIDASDSLTDETPVARVELRFSASGSGVLKAPWDRSALVDVSATSSGEFPEGPRTTILLEASHGLGTEVNSELSYTFDEGGSHSLLVTPEHPSVDFRFQAYCRARGGPMAVALFHEGYCDFYEEGGVQLDRLSYVITPLPDYHVVDGQPTPRG